MLDPEYLWRIADPVVSIWESLNQWAIQDIVYRLMMAEIYNYDKLPGTARWRTWLLNQSGMHYEEIIKKIEQISNKSEEELRRLFVEAGLMSVKNDAEIFDKHGLTSPTLKSNKRFMQLLNAAYEQTNGSMHNFTRTTADASQKLLIDTLDRAYFDAISGNRSASEVITDAIDTIASAGVTVTYPSGHTDTVETATRRAVQTGISQGTAKVTLENCRQLGAEYVVVDAHPGARVSDKDSIANHMGWQGKVYKIDGSSQKYENLEKATGFPGNPLGLCGYNCRHHIFPFFPGEDINRWENLVDEEESRKLYEMSQKQRRMERNIRASKRKLQGLSTAIENCRDEKTKFELQNEYDKSSARLQKLNKRYKDFCKDNAEFGIKTEQERLRTLGWNREYADRARSGASRYKSVKSVRETDNRQPYKSELFFGSTLQRSKQVDSFLNNYCTKKSMWSGQTIIDAEICMRERIAGKKAWSCDIITYEGVQDKTLMHEHLHARSVSYYSPDKYIKFRKTEEASVEFFAQELCRRYGIDYASAYDKWVSCLREINKILNLYSNDFDFAKAFYEINMPERWKWLSDRVDKYIKMNQLSNTDALILRKKVNTLFGGD